MKKVLTILTFLLLALFVNQEASATHYMGGEITWTCTPQGNFKFTLKLYRECYTSNGGSAANYGASVNLTSNAPGFSSISMTRISVTDLSPDCNAIGPSIYCPGMANGAANMGALEEHIYTSDASYPTGVGLTGTPPATGWTFGYSSCCRNPSANIQGQPAWWIRAIMYPYNNTPVNTCFDNSPRFDEVPSTVICTGYPFTYNHLASDQELDSLTYAWDQPYSAANTPIVNYFPGYSFNSPLPGVTQNPNNVAATVNANTGEISFTSYTNGAFVTVTKVTAWKCGVKVAEIFREMQVVLLSCGTNTPPDVTPPFPNGAGQYTLYGDTVYAGQLVQFSISATDFEFLPNGNAQTMELTATGAQFGTPINPGGCLNPPCATLTPAPTPTSPITGQFGVQTAFSWQTTCDHLATNVGCGQTSNVYTFLFKTSDDFCPAPGIQFSTVTIWVLTKPTLPSPDVHCLKVLNNGDVELTWNEIVDTMGTFNSYHIWSSTTPAGPFTVIDSIFNISTTSYTHIGAGANTGPVYYYMTTRSGCSGNEMSQPVDTASTIYLDVVNPGAAFGVANLSWNPTHDPLLPSSSGVYQIYREYPAGVWMNIDSVTNELYVDTITFCNQFINYRIEMNDTVAWDTLGNPIICTSVSNVDGDIFQDITPPQIPNLELVTIDNLTGNVNMNWTVNSSEDTEGYIIYTQSTGVWTPLDTIWGRSDTVYTDIINNPCNESITYNIAAFDSCFNTSAMGLELNTIFAKVGQIGCEETDTLWWNHYINMSPALGGYNIYVSVDGAFPTLLTTLPATANTYSHQNLTMNSEYCYVIEAFSTDTSKSSTSCIVCQTVSMPNRPQFLYLKNATVENDDHVQVALHTDETVHVTEYQLYRSEDLITWTQIATLPMSPTPEILHNDYQAQFRAKSYYYQAVVIDSCGFPADTSNIARTIYLQLTTDQVAMTNTLDWNDYEVYDGGVQAYNVYRRIDGVLDPLPIATLAPPAAPYIDDAGAYPVSGGRFSYYIEAVEGAGNQYGLAEMSLSNEVQALMNPKIFIPNAFTPKGVANQVFKPEGVFVPGGNYEFTVYNRLGQVMFMTLDIQEGWDGTFDGLLMPTGVYAYSVRFTSSTGNVIEKYGTVSLIY